MKTIQNTKVVNDNGTVIDGSEESYWIEVHPSDADAVANGTGSETDRLAYQLAAAGNEEGKRAVYDNGTDLARNDGNGDAALHAAMVEDTSHGLRSVFFLWDEENVTWWRVALADL